jgi:hypothetical protein
MRVWTLVMVAVLATSSEAAVICRKKSGSMVIRDADCKKKETPVDLAQFGAAGPKGDPGPAGSIEGAPADARPVEIGRFPIAITSGGATPVGTALL